MAYLLDAGTLAEVLRRVPSPSMVRRLTSVPPRDRWTSVISVSQLLLAARRAGSRPRLMQDVVRLVAAVKVAPFDMPAAQMFAKLRAGGSLPPGGSLSASLPPGGSLSASLPPGGSLGASSPPGGSLGASSPPGGSLGSLAELDAPDDAMIAAIALANDFTLVTRRPGDFARFPHLRAESWI
jgi:tRNA(fMet)-specific endonuclease VapC